MATKEQIMAAWREVASRHGFDPNNIFARISLDRGDIAAALDAAALEKTNEPTITCPACLGRTTVTNEDGWGRDVIGGCDFCSARGYLPRSDAHGKLRGRLHTLAKMPYGRWNDDWAYYVLAHPEVFDEQERALVNTMLGRGLDAEAAPSSATPAKGQRDKARDDRA
jgi:hypothetical protein